MYREKKVPNARTNLSQVKALPQISCSVISAYYFDTSIFMHAEVFDSNFYQRLNIM